MKIEVLLSKYYGLEPLKISTLEGYESINYKIKTEENTYVLKQHKNNKRTHALLLAEHRIMDELVALPKYEFSRTILNKEGQPMVEEEDHIFRLLSYVEGDFLANVDHSNELLHSLGVCLGHTNWAFQDIYDPVLFAKETVWDLKHFRSNHPYLEYIKDSKDRSLLAYFFLQFDTHVYPIQHLLRKQIIHNDANDWNVLTTNGKVSGIIDFGDMCCSWLINELAIGLTYAMMNKESPLEAAMPIIRGYQGIYPLEQQELDVLYYLIAARLCTSLCNSAYTKTLKPDSDYILISEQPAWNLLHQWVAISPIKAKDSFRKAAGYSVSKKKPLEKQLQERNKNISNSLSLTYDRPITMTQSAFQYMYDDQGNTILDAYNNIMQVGHSHPKVVKAGQTALSKLNTNTRYLYPELLSYSEKLLSKFPTTLSKVFFVNSGSAASDLAIRIAMAHTKKKKAMVLEHGYHGNTRMGIDISHYKYNHTSGGGQQEHIIATPLPKVFGAGFASEKEACSHFVSITEKQINTHSGEIAAFIAEPIVGCGGQVPLAKDYLKAIYPKIRAQGGVCISDEVQVGFGRLGSYFWGYEMHGVVPDMVILGKPMGNGHPIGAVVTTTEIAKSFENGPEFFSSFGGNPVSCAIGEAVLDVIEEERLATHAKEIGVFLMKLLLQLKKQYLEIADVRGEGLFLGVELIYKNGSPNTQLAHSIKNKLRERNILISTDGPFDNVLKIKPPLSFTKANGETLIKEIESILAELTKF